MVLEPVGGAAAPTSAESPASDDPQVMMDFAKDTIVVATLEKEGGSCTYERLFAVAEDYHCDVLAAAVMSLKRAKRIHYDGAMLLMPGDKDVVISLGSEPSPAAAKAAQEKAEAAAREKAAQEKAEAAAREKAAQEKAAAAAAEQARRDAAAAAEAEAKRKAEAEAARKAEVEAQAKARAVAEAKAAAEAQAQAERQAAALAEEKAKAEAVAAVAESDTVIATYCCQMKSQIREGFAMDSDKAGVLGKGEVIEALEERVNESGTVRVRFSKGWVSMKTGKGDVVLEPVGGAAAPTSAESPQQAEDPVVARVAALKEDGMQYFANREFVKSIATLQEAARLDPADEEITEALAFAQQAEVQYNQDQSVKLQERAMEYFTNREFDAAVDALQKALTYTPGHEEILEALEYAKSQTAVE